MRFPREKLEVVLPPAPLSRTTKSRITKKSIYVRPEIAALIDSRAKELGISPGEYVERAVFSAVRKRKAGFEKIHVTDVKRET